jgi:NAD(P)-dependent dehydrogenase (short-subunit alcohol dehydrogenase family)
MSVPSFFAGRFDGHVGLVTGGASGIGLGIARRLLAEGASVVLGDRDSAALDRAVADLGTPDAEKRVTAVRADVSRESDVEALVAAAVAAYGSLTCAFNVAAVGGRSTPIVDLPAADWNAVLDVGLTGAFLCMKHEARQMIGQGGGGAIVNMASINGLLPGDRMSAYSTAKAGLLMLTRVGALEFGEHGLRVNAVAPGLIETPLTGVLFDVEPAKQAFLDATPLGRTGTVADVAAAALFLASDEAAWTSGTTLVVDGGELTTGFPRLARLFAELAATRPEE